MDLRGTAGTAASVAIVVSLVVGPLRAQEQGEPPRSGDVAALLEKGQAALSAGDHKKALRLFEKADEVAGGRSMAALYRAGTACYALDDLDRTEEYARRLIARAQGPLDVAPGYYLLGVSLSKRDPPFLMQAVEAFNIALSLAGNQANPCRCDLADALIRLGDTDEATRVLADYFSAGGTRYAAITLTDQRHLREAEAALQEVLTLLPDRATEVRVSLEQVYWRQLDLSAYDPLQLEKCRFLEVPSCRGYSDAADALADDIIRQPTGSISLPTPEPREPFRYKPGGKISEPVRITGPNPLYPEAARRARIQGVVVMETVIGKDGRIKCITVLRGLPKGLTCSAAFAVSKWFFEPSSLDGEPVEVLYILTVRFNLK